MFGPGVSTMPSESRAKPSSEERWGMGETRGKNERVSNARPTVMSFRKLYREQFIGGGGALPLPLAGEGWGGGAQREYSASGESPPPPRSASAIAEASLRRSSSRTARRRRPMLPRKRER